MLLMRSVAEKRLLGNSGTDPTSCASRTLPGEILCNILLNGQCHQIVDALENLRSCQESTQTQSATAAHRAMAPEPSQAATRGREEGVGWQDTQKCAPPGLPVEDIRPVSSPARRRGQDVMRSSHSRNTYDAGDHRCRCQPWQRSVQAVLEQFAASEIC